VERDTVRTVVVAVLCILALSAAAATLDSAQGGDGDGGWLGAVVDWLPLPSPTADEPPEDMGARVQDAELQDSLSPLQALFCIPALRDPTVQLAILALFLGTVAGIVWRFDVIEATTGLTLLAAPTILFLFIFDFTMRNCNAETADMPVGSIPGSDAGGGTGEGATEPVATAPELLVLAVLAVALVGAVAAILASSGDDEAEAAAADDGGPATGDLATAPLATLADAAGSAADRIEASGEVDNEVYRAWREMTDGLAVSNPESSTPAEFRAAAVDAGMDPELVDEVTAVFEAVRYGGREPTGDRERRAVEALRAIEDAYGDGTD
jgi:hypothetical protein